MPEIERERLFIGVPLSEEARREIASRLPSPLPGRAVPADKWHFTLRFLGGTDQDARLSLIESLSAARLVVPFDIRFEGLGAFPGPGRARVLWVGVETGKAELKALAQRVESALEQAGFAPEARPFNAHLTVSRIQPPSSVKTTVTRGRDVRGSMRVDKVVLFRSHLGRGGSRYEWIAEFPLGLRRRGDPT